MDNKSSTKTSKNNDSTNKEWVQCLGVSWCNVVASGVSDVAQCCHSHRRLARRHQAASGLCRQLQGSAGNSDGPQFFLQDIVLLKKIGPLKRTCPNSFCIHPHDWSKVAMFVSRLKHHSSIGRLLWWTLATQELLSSFEVVLDQEATMKCAEKIFSAVGAAKMGWFLATSTWGF